LLVHRSVKTKKIYFINFIFIFIFFFFGEFLWIWYTSGEPLNFDCLILTTCEVSSYIYVVFEEGVGNDSTSCGTEATPCKTIPYTLEMAAADQEIRVVHSGMDIATFGYSLPGKVFRVVGIPTLLSGELNYPQIVMDYTEVSVMNFTQRCRGTFDSFRLLVNSSLTQAPRYFFYQTSNGNNAYMRFLFVFTDCFVTDVLF
jgi:hypothetical protein